MAFVRLRERLGHPSGSLRSGHDEPITPSMATLGLTRQQRIDEAVEARRRELRQATTGPELDAALGTARIPYLIAAGVQQEQRREQLLAMVEADLY